MTGQSQVNATNRVTLQSAVPPHAQTRASVPIEHTALQYGWQPVDGIRLFYREGGPINAPTSLQSVLNGAYRWDGSGGTKLLRT
jgi:hypothetical protein